MKSAIAAPSPAVKLELATLLLGLLGHFDERNRHASRGRSELNTVVDCPKLNEWFRQRAGLDSDWPAENTWKLLKQRLSREGEGRGEILAVKDLLRLNTATRDLGLVDRRVSASSHLAYEYRPGYFRLKKKDTAVGTVYVYKSPHLIRMVDAVVVELEAVSESTEIVEWKSHQGERVGRQSPARKFSVVSEVEQNALQPAYPGQGPVIRPLDPGPIPPVFVGRESALAQAQADPNATVILVSGEPGVGKTAFANVLANVLAPSYPDGCVRIDGRAYGVEAAMTSVEIARSVCSRLDLEVADSSEEDGEVLSRFRSLIGQKTVLIVLDNVADPELVLDLIGGGKSRMIVTSRKNLPSVAVKVKSTLVPLGLLSSADGVLVLSQVLTEYRVNSELDDARRIVESCGRLPLALSIVGAKLRMYPDRRLSRVAAELGSARAVILEESLPDSAFTIATVLDWSFDTVTPAQQYALILLAFCPMRYIGDVSIGHLGVARGDLAQLVNENLLWRSEVASSYYFHDLVREYLRSVPTYERANLPDDSPGMSKLWAVAMDEVNTEVENFLHMLIRRREAHRVEDIGELLPYSDKPLVEFSDWWRQAPNLVEMSSFLRSIGSYELSAEFAMNAAICLLQVGAFEFVTSALLQVAHTLEAWRLSVEGQVVAGDRAKLAHYVSQAQQFAEHAEFSVAVYAVRTTWAERCEPVRSALRKVAARLGVPPSPRSLYDLFEEFIESDTALRDAVIRTMQISELWPPSSGNEHDVATVQSFQELIDLERKSLALWQANENVVPVYAEMYEKAKAAAAQTRTMDFLWSVEAPLLRWVRCLEEWDEKPGFVIGVLFTVHALNWSRGYQGGHEQKLFEWIRATRDRMMADPKPEMTTKK